MVLLAEVIACSLRVEIEIEPITIKLKGIRLERKTQNLERKIRTIKTKKKLDVKMISYF